LQEIMTAVAQTDQARYNYERIFTRKGPPQGMTSERFLEVSIRLRERLRQEAERTGQFGDDLFVHGSRAQGTAAPDADLDMGIRVSVEQFQRLVRDRLARVRPAGDKWATLQEAIRHAGEAGISGIRKEIQKLINEELRLGFLKGVQITVIREGGPFDQGPFIPLPGGPS
jgi:hypothetical protein